MIQPRQRPTRRRGMASLDAVICLGVALPLAAALYLVAQYVLDLFFFLVGSVVGSPFL